MAKRRDMSGTVRCLDCGMTAQYPGGNMNAPLILRHTDSCPQRWLGYKLKIWKEQRLGKPFQGMWKVRCPKCHTKQNKTSIQYWGFGAAYGWAMIHLWSDHKWGVKR